MLLNQKKSKLATIVVSKAKPFDGPAKEPMTTDAAESDDSVALEAAAEKVMSAVESKDAKALVSALKSMLTILDASEPKGDE